MTSNEICDESRSTPQRLKSALHTLRVRVTSRFMKASAKTESLPKPQVIAYNLLGRRTDQLLPVFKDLELHLQKSDIKISFKGYVSLAILASLVLSISALAIIPLTAALVLHLSLFSSLLYTLGGTLFTGAFTIIAFYLYPIIKADTLKRNLEDGLPFMTGYLSILAGAGVTPPKMLRSLAKVDPTLAISREAKNIVRDMELFGADIISAMESASQRTPSEKFRELAEGFIATIHSGGDLAKYLSERSGEYMRSKRIALQRLSDTLSVLAEFYVVLLVAGPLILVVMLAVMAMLGGGITGLLGPRLLLQLLTYLGIPLGSFSFLIMLDVITPKR